MKFEALAFSCTSNCPPFCPYRSICIRLSLTMFGDVVFALLTACDCLSGVAKGELDPNAVRNDDNDLAKEGQVRSTMDMMRLIRGREEN